MTSTMPHGPHMVRIKGMTNAIVKEKNLANMRHAELFFLLTSSTFPCIHFEPSGI